MKFKINYEFDKIKTNLNGGTSSTSTSSTSSTNNFPGIFEKTNKVIKLRRIFILETQIPEFIILH